ncbi:hypothetical protein ACROYT_G032584 [Oculina patagonica]
MLRSAFRGKQPADSTAKDEKQGKSAHGKSHFFFNRDHEGHGDANMNENLNTLVTEGVSYSASDGELTIDYDHEFFEATQGSSSDKDSVNGEENMSKSLSPESGAKPDQEAIKTSRDSFSSSERQIYEMQLAQLQEQLVNTMIDYQDMSTQVEKLKAVDVDKLQKELQEEKAKNNELKEKLKQKHKSSTSKLQRKNASRMDPRHGHGMAADSSERGGDDWVDLGREEELHSSLSHDTNGNAASGVHSRHEHEETSYDILDGVHAGHVEEETATRSGEVESHRVQRVKTKLEMWKAQAVDLLLDRMWDFVNDEPEAADEEDGEGEPLAVKTLKENINRFTASIKPITGFIKSVHKVFTWYNPTASFMIFLVYMYSVWHGFLLSLILFTMIWKLFMNYLHAKGIAKQLGFTEKAKEETATEDHSWSDKFQLVLQVARKVQNTLGKMADSLEKVKNLLTWQHPVAARKLFTALCFALLASLALRGPTLFRLIGLSLGIKLFIVNPIYHRFPKVKRRYDGTAKLWRELPTDAELSARQMEAETSQEMPVRTSSMSSLSPPSTSSSEQSSSSSSNHVVEKFKLPSTEIILPGWEDGKRCALMNKDKPLSNVKHGRLFLTQSYLCFEKIRSSSGKNLVMKLDTITSISKAKPIGIMPGTGMALEVHVRGVEKPYIFGGIIGRDDVFESIKATGRAGNIPWALM